MHLKFIAVIILVVILIVIGLYTDIHLTQQRKRKQANKLKDRNSL